MDKLYQNWAYHQVLIHTGQKKKFKIESNMLKEVRPKLIKQGLIQKVKGEYELTSLGEKVRDLGSQYYILTFDYNKAVEKLNGRFEKMVGKNE